MTLCHLAQLTFSVVIFTQNFFVIARLLQVEWVWKKEIGQIDLHVVKVNLTKAQSRKSKKSKFWGANFNKERI